MHKKILMVAAENDALPGAKVGGVGDVIRDLPVALTRQNCEVDVVIPSYGFLSRLDKLETVAEYDVHFADRLHTITLFLAPSTNPGINQYIVHHPMAFSVQGETVYCNDEGGQPFATDATKFALFSLAVAQGLKLGILNRPEILHCHDWHTAFLLILIRYHGVFRDLQTIRSVFTIHNLAMQGIRPLSGDPSSLAAWFPGLNYEQEVINDLKLPHCINPMRAAILIADKIHTVSPTYAQEILQSSDHARGIYGGEGLEYELRGRAHGGSLVGIINGCEYPEVRYTKPSKKKIVEHIEHSLLRWVSKTEYMKSAHWLAHKRFQQWSIKKTTGMIVTSVGRITDQKLRLLHTRIKGQETALEKILKHLGNKGTFILLGSGDPKLETFLLGVSGDYENFIFLNGYSDTLSHALYAYGNLFLMPSSFEPCGISQMLAMRAGQPCLVNSVGGLRDTVVHGKNGYCFSGGELESQAEQLVDMFLAAVKDYKDSPENWKAMSKAASDTRFTWDSSAQQHIELLYTL